jgi:hypothetical protein
MLRHDDIAYAKNFIDIMIKAIETKAEGNIDERHADLVKLQDILWTELNKSLYIKAI